MMITLSPYKSCLIVGLLLVLALNPTFSQEAQTAEAPVFDSNLLRLKVPEAFQKNSLKLEVFADSSWQVFRGQEGLSFEESLELLGLSGKLDQHRQHVEREEGLTREYRSRRVFSIVTAMVGGGYLGITWSKGWVYQIPGYAALAIAGVRYLDSRRLEIQALREHYYQTALINPSEIQRLVDDYNFRLYQYLSTAGIQFHAE